jgi:hypothetical protein
MLPLKKIYLLAKMFNLVTNYVFLKVVYSVLKVVLSLCLYAVNRKGTDCYFWAILTKAKVK